MFLRKTLLVAITNYVHFNECCYNINYFMSTENGRGRSRPTSLQFTEPTVTSRSTDMLSSPTHTPTMSPREHSASLGAIRRSPNSRRRGSHVLSSLETLLEDEKKRTYEMTDHECWRQTRWTFRKLFANYKFPNGTEGIHRAGPETRPSILQRTVSTKDCYCTAAWNFWGRKWKRRYFS